MKKKSALKTAKQTNSTQKGEHNHLENSAIVPAVISPAKTKGENDLWSKT